MIELPEAVTLAKQITGSLQGKKIKEALAGYSPHKYAWFHGDPAEYKSRLQGKTIGEAVSRGGMVEVQVENQVLLFADGVALRFWDQGEKLPVKHQLLVEFEDGSAFTGSVQMYGGLWYF